MLWSRRDWRPLLPTAPAKVWELSKPVRAPAARSALRTASCLGHGVARGERFCASGPRSPWVWVALLVVGHGDDDATGHGAVEDEFRRTPTWRAKCQISGSGRPLRFEHWGARGDFASYLPAPLRHARI